jgi:hypothetical protein
MQSILAIAEETSNDAPAAGTNVPVYVLPIFNTNSIKWNESKLHSQSWFDPLVMSSCA